MRFVAGLTSMVAGLGLPCAWGIVHLARTGETWTFLGFPTYGGDLFERAGIETTVPLLAGSSSSASSFTVGVLDGWVLLVEIVR